MRTVLKDLREKAGYTLRELQKETGISASRISRHEHRRERIWRGDVERYRKVLAIPEEGIADKGGFARFLE
jgi:transcriptional regulator with XRE-family HTH domain